MLIGDYKYTFRVLVCVQSVYSSVYDVCNLTN